MLKNQEKGLRKALSMLLAIVFVVTMLPIMASAADAPAFVSGYPKPGAAQANGSKKIEVLIQGILPDNETSMGLGYVLLADGDPAPAAEQIVSGGKIPGATVITYATQAATDAETPITLTGAQDNTAYDLYAVFYKGQAKDGVFSEVEKLDVTTPAGSGGPGTPMLDPPTGLMWDTTDGIKAKWNEVVSAASYDVTLWKEGQSTMLVQYSPTGTAANIDISSPGSYHFTVQAKAEGYTSSVKPASPSCHLVSTPEELEAALGKAADGDTIKLMTGIAYNKGIVISGKPLTFALGGFNLNINTGDSTGLWVSGGGKLSCTGSGKLNVTASRNGVRVSDASEAHVSGSVMAGQYGVMTSGGSSKVIVDGSVAATGQGVEAGAEVEAISAGGYANVTIGGSVTASRTLPTQAVTAIYSNGSTISVGKDVNSQGNGVTVVNDGEVIIEGALNHNSDGDQTYIKLGSVAKGSEAFVPSVSKPGYREYTDGNNAVWIRGGAAVCAIGATPYATLDAALATIGTGESKTITLLRTITHTTQIRVEGITVNLDLGHHDLLLDISGNEAFGPALIVRDGGKVRLVGIGTGEFHVKGRSGISAIGINAEVTVHTVEAADGSGVYMYGSGDFLESNSTVTVLGSAVAGKNSITVDNGTGVDMNAKNGKVIVHGNIASGRDGVFIASNPNTQVTVNGNVTVTSDSPTANLVGIRAYGATTVTVTGDVSVQGSECLGVHASGSYIKVGGSVSSSGAGAQSDANGKVEITGSLTAGIPFITVGTTEMAADQGSPTEDGFLRYTSGSNYVQIKSAGVPVTNHTVTFNLNGGTRTGGGALAQTVPNGGSATEPAVTRSGYTFTGWDRSFANVTQDLTVTATWSYNGGSPGGSAAVNASITPKTASFDMSPTTSDHADISVTLSSGSYALSRILLGGKALVKGTDYTVNGSTATFKKVCLATLMKGEHQITFDMSGGADPVLTITITDKTNTGALIPFEDIAADDWFAGSVMWAFGTGLMKGVSEKPVLFYPHGAATRGMIVTILHRLENTPGTLASNPFADVAAGTWYGEAVVWAAENKIVSGYGEGQFGPGDAITREQLAAILMNYAKLKGYDVSARADLSGFADAVTVSGWAMDAMSWACATGLIQGEGTKLNPTGNAERCQIAAILQRFVKNIAKQQTGR